MLSAAVPTPSTDRQTLVSVCCHCHRVKSRAGGWDDHPLPDAARVSHGICPDCIAAYYPEYAPAVLGEIGPDRA
jgi:hypothetical protein